MIKEVLSIKLGEPKYCIIALPGRGGCAETIASFYAEEAGLSNVLIVGITPEGYAWYPIPISSYDQERALAGLPVARKAIESVLTRIEKKYEIAREDTAILGFSAGGVMALEVASKSDKPFAAVICHSGAILEPKDFPECAHPDMPVVLTHGTNDDCFDWYERYVPMKAALKDNGYYLHSLEIDGGVHRLSQYEIEQAGAFLAENCFEQDASIWDEIKDDEEWGDYSPCAIKRC